MDSTVQNNTKIKTNSVDTASAASIAGINPIDTASTDKILHEKFTLYGKNAREWMQKCVLLLPEIDQREIWRKKGFSSIYEYAAKLAGMSRNTVDSALWTFQKTQDKPELKAVIEEKGITSVRLVANLATQETEGFWAEKTRGMSSYALAAYIKEFRKHKNHSCFESRIPAAKQTQNIAMDLDPEIADHLQKLKGQGNWNELMKKFIALHQEKLEAQKPVPVENAKRHVPAAIKKYALAKTNKTCAFPGCAKPYKILHHTNRFALTHTHNPDNLVPLCKAHERLAHHGLIENENAPPNEWRVREQPDRTNEKYKIDQLVIEHRTAPK